MTIAVRHAGTSDLAAVRACLEAAFDRYRTAYTPGAIRDTVPTIEGLAERLRTMTILVAEGESPAIIGTVAYRQTGPTVGHLRGMAVLPEFQGKGVADHLLTTAEAELRARGCVRITLDTVEPLARAIRFYERHGYSRTGVVTDLHGMPLHDFEKTI